MSDVREWLSVHCPDAMPWQVDYVEAMVTARHEGGVTVSRRRAAVRAGVCTGDDRRVSCGLRRDGGNAMSDGWPRWIVSAPGAQQQKAMLDSISRMDFSWPETVDTRAITVPTLCAETEGTEP